MSEFYIIGAGMGGEGGLTVQGRQAILESDAVLATGRIKASLAQLRGDIREVKYTELAVAAAACSGTVAVLVSGDTGFFSAADSLRKELEPWGRVHMICGISSMQYFISRVGGGYEDILPISLHGRDISILGPVAYNRRVFVLTGGESRADTICANLDAAGLGEVKVYIGENLGGDRERILSGHARSLKNKSIDGLAVMLIENPSPRNPAISLQDRDFITGDVPMTKEHIRTLVAASLDIQPGDTVFDIGAGSGSCAMEFAARANMGMVYALEKKDKAVRLCRENRRHTKSWNVSVVQSTAPDGLEALPRPDCAFLGGTSGQVHGILETLLGKNANIRVAMTAITLETLHAGQQALERLNFEDVQIVCINVSKAKRLGGATMMMGQNPIYLLTGRGCGSGD